MTKARYDEVAQYYEGVMRPFERWVIPGLRQAALNEIPIGARILEVGAGTGLNFVHYPKDATGVASEFSREMLKHARAKNRPRGVDSTELCWGSPFQTLLLMLRLRHCFCSVASPVKPWLNCVAWFVQVELLSCWSTFDRVVCWDHFSIS